MRDLIEQVLFTAPGERVMRPDFGSGLLALVFEPGGPELAAHRRSSWCRARCSSELGDLIAVESVEVDAGRRRARRSSVAYVVAAHAGSGRPPSFSSGRAVRYACCDERRAATAVAARPASSTGSSTSRSRDSEAPSQALRQRTLFVRLLQPRRRR